MKTNNYLGKQDENRGIIAFLIVFVVVVILIGIIFFTNKIKNIAEEYNSATIDEIYYDLQKGNSDIDKFEIKDGNLILEGEYDENVSQNLLSKLVNFQLVLKNVDGDKYEYNLDYYISTSGIDYSTYEKDGDKIKYLVDLNNIEPGEYFVLLRTKTSSSKTEEGYIYKYYTLENDTETDELTYKNIKVSFDSSNKVESFLKVVKE